MISESDMTRGWTINFLSVALFFCSLSGQCRTCLQRCLFVALNVPISAPTCVHCSSVLFHALCLVITSRPWQKWLHCDVLLIAF